MKLCFLGDAGSIHLQRWIKYFVDSGYEVDVISFRPGPVHGAKLHLLAAGRSDKYAYGMGLARIRGLVKRIQPDILHAHYATSFGLLALVSGFHPLVVSAWGSDVLVSPEKSAVLRRVVQSVLRGADALTSDSAYMTGKMEALLAGVSKPLQTVTMGVSRAWFDKGAQTPAKPCRIISLRGHHPIYNIDTIIKAMAEVVKTLPHATLVVAGEGPETPRLKQLASSLGVNDSIKFVGQLAHTEIQTYLSESTVSVSVPSSDATAVSLLETMTCGPLPVVSDLPANREWVEDGINGLIVQPGDVEALAGALVRGLDDQPFRDNARSINRQRIADKAIWENNMQEIAGLYIKLLS